MFGFRPTKSLELLQNHLPDIPVIKEKVEVLTVWQKDVNNWREKIDKDIVRVGQGLHEIKETSGKLDERTKWLMKLTVAIPVTKFFLDNIWAILEWIAKLEIRIDL